MRHSLIIDDSSVVRKVARRILEELDFDVVEAEAPERPIDRRQDVVARQPDLVRARAHAPANLRGDDDLIARPAEPSQRLSEQRLGLALGVHIRGVDEVDAGIERTTEYFRQVLAAGG